MIIKIAGAALCGVMCCLMLKSHKPEFVPLCETVTAAVIFIMIADELIGVKDFFSQLLAGAGISGDYLLILLKSLGTALAAQFAADAARDAGETALASKIEFAGRVVIIYCSLPLLKAIAQLISGLTENM